MQYIDYITDVLQGDLGQSFLHNEPVAEVLLPAIPWTLFLGAIAVFISFVSRVIIGGTLAYVEGSRFDFGATTTLVWIHAFPYYVVAILLLFTFGYQLDWFPINGRVNSAVPAGLNYEFIAGILHHAALPIISLAWASFGAGAIVMRANAIQIIGEDYVRVARLRGIPTSRITIWYVARNAILPMYTQMLLSIGFMFGGSVILETIFQYPGVGYYIVNSINARDYPMMMAGFLIITVAVVIAMLVADLTYGMVDPRVNRGENNA
jgi:peptide/nickel transport system permease protein